MTEKSTTPLELATVKALGQQVTKAEGELKLRAKEEMAVGDRKTAYLPDGRKVGSVSYVTGSRRAAVTDPAAFLAWVKETHPTEVETVETVREAFRKVVLANPVNPDTGEIPPGVDLVEGEPYVRADVKPEQAEAIAMAWAAGELGVDPLREITGGTG